MRYELAQLNVALMLEPLESPRFADFVHNLDRVNALADGAEGFVWRLQTDDGDATALRPVGDDVLVNLSVWRNEATSRQTERLTSTSSPTGRSAVASLRDFVYGGPHVDIMKKRKKWFEKMRQAHMVLWWVPAGERPDVDEALARLEHLRRHGPTAHAFTFAEPFEPPAQ